MKRPPAVLFASLALAVAAGCGEDEPKEKPASDQPGSMSPPEATVFDVEAALN